MPVIAAPPGVAASLNELPTFCTAKYERPSTRPGSGASCGRRRVWSAARPALLVLSGVSASGVTATSVQPPVARQRLSASLIRRASIRIA